MPPRVSFEFFPPRSLGASFRLWETVQALSPLSPAFVSVTYGAGGTTRKLTHEAVEVIHSHYTLPVAAHLTCVDASREETLAIADSYSDLGVTEIVALRGDPSKGQKRFQPRPDGFSSSVELIETLAGSGKFNIRVGAYPDKHPEAADNDADIEWLKRKLDAGASGAITQFFFDADTFLRFRDRCERAGITAPIIPGILPIDHWQKVRSFAVKCGVPVPVRLDQMFEKAERDERADLLSIVLCTELCSKLIDNGVEDLHFYTLNRPYLTHEICRALGVVPEIKLRNVA